jgi:PKD repeat protein
VETGEATEVGHTRVIVTGELTELGTADTATVSVEYWESGADERRETTAEALSEPGAVEVDLTGLRQDTAYAFRALADSGTESDAGSTEAFATPIEEVSRSTVDRTAAGDATFSQWGDGYRLRAAGKSPFQRPRNEHGYGAVYGEAAGDVIVQTTLAGLRGEHDLRLAGLVVTNDILGGGGVAGDLLLAAEPTAGVSLVTYDEGRREYETVASAGVPFEAPVDLRLIKGDGEFVAEYRRATDTDWQPVGSVAVPTANASQHAGLFATAGHERNRCVADFTEFRIGETGVTLLPSARVIPPDVETTLDLVVENAENGIRSYTATIDVPDTDLLTIEEVTVAGDPPHQSVDILPDGSRATIKAGIEGNTGGAGDVRIAELTVHTGAVGTVSVTLPEVVVVDDAAAVPYDIAAVEGSKLTVAEGVGPPPVVGDDPPRDIDGDGLYRDVDGDGQFTVSDVQAFFDHRREDVVLNNAEYFNFAGGDPPDVSLADVQALFQDLVARDPDAAAAVGLGVTDTDEIADLTAADLWRALEE